MSQELHNVKNHFVKSFYKFAWVIRKKKPNVEVLSTPRRIFPNHPGEFVKAFDKVGGSH